MTSTAVTSDAVASDAVMPTAATPVAVRQRIFVVGVPRSGTTLVQSLLAAHRRVTSFTESHFFSRHFRLVPWTSTALWTRDVAPRVQEFSAENGIDPAPGGLASFAPASPRPWRSRSTARRLLALLDHVAVQRGAPIWIEKTPRHLRYTPFLSSLYPADRQPHVIHVIRDGLETVASLHTASQHWQRPYDLATCVRRWNADVAFSLRLLWRQSVDPEALRRHHVVIYEDLTRQPEVVLRPLLAALRLDWQPDLLHEHARHAEPLVTREETWKSDLDRPLEPSATSHRALTEGQRQRARKALRRDLYHQLRDLASP